MLLFQSSCIYSKAKGKDENFPPDILKNFRNLKTLSCAPAAACKL